MIFEDNFLSVKRDFEGELSRSKGGLNALQTDAISAMGLKDRCSNT